MRRGETVKWECVCREKTKRVGLFGGSFDPPHKGHMALAEAAIKEGKLDRLIIMPVFMQPFKLDRKVTDDEFRLEMARIAFGQIEGAEVSSYEMDKEGISYTVDTLAHMGDKYPDSEIFIVMGTDSFLELELWKCGEEILRKYSVMVSVRPGYREQELDERSKQYRRRYRTRVIKLKSTMPDISSTEIREAIEEGRLAEEGYADKMITQEVASYIAHNHLYGQ